MEQQGAGHAKPRCDVAFEGHGLLPSNPWLNDPLLGLSEMALAHGFGNLLSKLFDLVRRRMVRSPV